MDRQEWMSALPDEIRISELSIPGTHDSAAYRGNLPGLGFTQTQSWNIQQQLDNGVRFFDLRCRAIGDNLMMHHGPVYLGMSLNDVLITLERFVIAHPHEGLIISLKKDHHSEQSSMQFSEIFEERIMPGRETYYFLEPRIPTLGELRGKILLIRRFDGYYGGFPTEWEDKATFTFEHYGQTVHVQDVYGSYTAFDFIRKREVVDRMATAALEGPAEDLYLNFLSLNGALTPYHAAYGDAFTNGTNLWFVGRFADLGPARLGIVIADYVDVRHGALIDTVLASNLGR